MPLPRRPSSIGSGSDDGVQAPVHRRRATSSSMASSRMTSSHMHDSDNAEGDEEQEWDRGASRAGTSAKRKKKDEPMSPVAVVFYVTALYLVFQLLTRADDLEILSHLPPTSSLLSSHHLNLGGSHLHSDLQQTPYGMPYQRPHIPSPIQNTAADGSSPGFWRSLFGVIIYPIYLLITLLTVPIPILLNVLHLLITVLDTIMYPLTSTLRLMFKTFVLAPAGIAKSVLDVFYPIIAFIGGVVGVGCAMGLGAGWVGRTVLDWITGKKRDSKSKGKRGDKKRSDAGTRSVRSVKISKSVRDGPKVRTPTKITTKPDEKKTAYSDSASGPEIVTPKHNAKLKLHPRGMHETDKTDEYEKRRKEEKRGSRKGMEERFAESAGHEQVFQGEAMGTAREAFVLGTRRRTHAIDAGTRY